MIGDELYQSLAECGYVSFIEAFDISKYPQRLAAEVYPTLDSSLQSACSLFCFGKRVSLSKLSCRIANVINKMAPSGLVRIEDGYASIAPLMLYVIGGMLYFAEIPNPLITAYFGEDSIALASRLNVLNSKKGKVLDLCSGPGIQGLLAAAVGHDTTAVEINPIAASISECNAALNGCLDRYRVENEPFEHFFKKSKDKYDRIFANPPLVPIPDEFSYQFVGAGGPDGLSITNKLIKNAPFMLNQGGEFITIGVSGGDETGPYILDSIDALERLGKFNCSLSLLKSFDFSPDSNWVAKIEQTLKSYSLNDDAPSTSEISDSYLASGISQGFFFHLSIRAPFESSNCSSTRVFDFSSKSVSSTPWWVC